MNLKIENEGKFTDWDYRFFHLYSDGKRIKELSHKIVQEKQRYQYFSERPILIVYSNGSWVGFWKGKHVLGLPLKQLKEVLEAVKK